MRQLTVYTALQRRTGPGGGAEARARLIQRHSAPEACVYAGQPPGPLPPCLSMQPHTVTAMRAQMHAQPHTRTPCTHSPAHTDSRRHSLPQENGCVSGLGDHWGSCWGSCHVTSSPENSLPFPQPITKSRIRSPVNTPFFERRMCVCVCVC